MTGNVFEPIETYLDELVVALRVPPRAMRRILAETEAHLRDVVDELSAHGMTQFEAEQEAVCRFGTNVEVAASCRSAHQPTPLQMAAATTSTMMFWAAWGLLAVGLSGGVAALMNSIGTSHFVGALPITHSSHACSTFLQMHPTAGTCQQAAALETAQDTVVQRVLAGLLGLGLLVVALLFRHKLRTSCINVLGVDALAATFAAIGFGGAAVVLTGLAINIAAARQRRRRLVPQRRHNFRAGVHPERRRCLPRSQTHRDARTSPHLHLTSLGTALH